MNRYAAVLATGSQTNLSIFTPSAPTDQRMNIVVYRIKTSYHPDHLLVRVRHGVLASSFATPAAGTTHRNTTKAALSTHWWRRRNMIARRDARGQSAKDAVRQWRLVLKGACRHS